MPAWIYLQAALTACGTGMPLARLDAIAATNPTLSVAFFSP